MQELIRKYVPHEYRWYAKDLLICIYNKERKRYPDLTDAQYLDKRNKKLKRLFQRVHKEQTLLEMLKEYYEKIKKEDA